MVRFPRAAASRPTYIMAIFTLGVFRYSREARYSGLMSSISAVGFYEFGGPETLEVVDLPMPVLEPGEALIEVRAATVNPTDTSFRGGNHVDRLAWRKPPYVPGVELAGEVVEVHPGSQEFSSIEVGQSVFGYVSPYSHGGGACAQYVAVDVRSLVRLPKDMDYVHAAALPMNGMTTLVAFDLMELPKQATLLVTGGPGALGSYVISVGHHLGYTVIADAYEKDREFLESLGARVVPRGPDMAAAVLDVCPDGVDGIVDGACIGDALGDLIKEGGAYAPVRAVDFHNRDGKIRVTPVHAREQIFNTEKLRHLAELAEMGVLQPRISRVIAMSEAADAHVALERGGVRGRQVIDLQL